MPAISTVIALVTKVAALGFGRARGRGYPAAALLAALAIAGLSAVGGRASAGAAIPPIPSAGAVAIQDDDDPGEEQDGDDAAAEDANDTLTGAGIDVSTLNVRIDAGECANPAEHTAAFPLPTASAVGSGDDDEAFVSEAEAPAPIADLLASPHVLVIDLDDAGLTVPIACADITGAVAGGTLVIGLEAAETGDLTGVVVLREAANGAATSVATYVILRADTEQDGETENTDDQDEDSGGGESGV